MPLRLIVAYRPPHYSGAENIQFFSAISDLADGCARVCVLGDFNLPQLNWDLFIYPDNDLYNSAASLVCNHGLTQFVDEPTRGNNILDLVLCSDAICIDDVHVLPPLGSSDHSVVSFTFYMSLSQQSDSDEISTRPNFSKADWPGLCNHLSTVNWLTVFAGCTTTEQYWEVFLHVVANSIDQFVPCYKITKHTTCAKRYPRHVRKLLSKKRHLWKLYRKFKTCALYSKYKRVSNCCSKAIRDCTAAYEDNLVNDGRLGSFYKYVNNKLNGSNGIAPLKNSSGAILYSDHDKAGLLNDYFSSVFTVDNGFIVTASLPHKVGTDVPPIFFTPSLVTKYINKLKTNGSPGPDGIPPEFYKVTANFVSFPLSQIFNLSLQTGHLPALWKLASITPVFKKGAASDPANYRPISLTCIACKLLETGVKDNLLKYLSQHKIISRHQHGFLSRKSTTTQLLECCLDWNIALNGHNNLDVIYLDFAKAFDSVVHSKLIAKLECYGINGMILLWIRNFLSDRFQFVKIGNSCSHVSPVISGVPQGSVLGPVLFILYINDICDLAPIGVTVKLFADDAKLYSVINNFTSADCLQSCLSAICTWSDLWQLKLSPSKCNVLHICPASVNASKSCCSHNYFIGQTTLPSVNSCTDLGVSYNNRLRFTPHIDLMVARASLRAKLILRCFQTRDCKLLAKAFIVFVRPLLEYCSVIWSPYFKNEIAKIESVQRYFTKRLHGLWNIPYASRLARLGLDSLYCRRVKVDLIMCYKVLHNLTCLNPDDFFMRSTVSYTRGHSMKLSKPHTLSVRDGCFFSNRVINLWNSLPDRFVMASTVHAFKFRVNNLHFSDFCISAC